jgi:RNA polymerase sigma-70 factor (ECF subfamily)
MNEDDAATSPTPEGKAAQRQALATAERILESMDPIKRVVFVMFELEGMACPEIAAELELPIGTVYSRLHAARKLFSDKAQHALNSKASRGRP